MEWDRWTLSLARILHARVVRPLDRYLAAWLELWDE